MQTEKDVFQADGKHRPLLDLIKTWIRERESGYGKEPPQAIIDRLVENKIPMHGLHGMVELARYELARDRGEDLTKFQTSLYLEADGVTNGAINAMMLLGREFTGDFVRLVAKGGVFLGKVGRVLNDYKDKIDLYQEIADKTQEKVAAHIGRLKGQKAQEVALALNRVLAELNADVLLVMEDGQEVPVFKRGLTKNRSGS